MLFLDGNVLRSGAIGLALDGNIAVDRSIPSNRRAHGLGPNSTSNCLESTSARAMGQQAEEKIEDALIGLGKM